MQQNRRIRNLRDLARGAALVTIAREPAYCGGDLAAAELLRALDGEVFDGVLGQA